MDSLSMGRSGMMMFAADMKMLAGAGNPKVTDRNRRAGSICSRMQRGRENIK